MKLLKFYADWCAPCKTLSKTMEGIEFDVPVEEVDIDENEELTAKYGIRGVPTLILVDVDLNEIHRASGAMTKEQLVEQFDQAVK